jgi:DNA invertase Pin-like site-specific DNA recombinase/uncharacterized protein with PIN domain
MQDWVDGSRMAIVLRRVSTPEQVDNYSWKNQLDLVGLAHQDGFTHVEVLDEAGVSGEDIENRAILQKVLEIIGRGTVGALYLMNFSRGSRDADLIDGYRIMKACREYHTIIRLPEGPLDLNRESDEDTADIGFLFAKRNKREMIKNMSRGQYRKAKDGKFIGGRPRFGYRFKYILTETRRGPRMMADWEIDPAEMEIVRFIHQHFPRYSTRRWATILNRLAKWGRVMYFPIKSRRDQERAGKKFRAWQQHDIVNIIRNRMLIGRLSYCAYDSPAYRKAQRKPSRYLRDQEPICAYRADLQAIDAETFERNNRILKQRAKTSPRTVNSSHAFSGVLRCPLCGAPMNSNGADSGIYFCSTRRRNGKSVCLGFSTHERPAHDLLVPLVAELLQLNIGPAITAIKQQQRPDVAIARLRADIERIDSELDHLMGYARQGAISAEQLKKENLRLTAEKNAKEAQVRKMQGPNQENKKLTSFTEEFLTNLPDFMQFLYERKTSVFNQVLRLVFQGVVLNTNQFGSRWKAGLILAQGKRTTRTFFLQAFTFNPDFENWAKQSGLILPVALQNILDYGCEMTGVPISAQL